MTWKRISLNQRTFNINSTILSFSHNNPIQFYVKPHVILRMIKILTNSFSFFLIFFLGIHVINAQTFKATGGSIPDTKETCFPMEDGTCPHKLYHYRRQYWAAVGQIAHRRDCSLHVFQTRYLPATRLPVLWPIASQFLLALANWQVFLPCSISEFWYSRKITRKET